MEPSSVAAAAGGGGGGGGGAAVVGGGGGGGREGEGVGGTKDWGMTGWDGNETVPLTPPPG